MINVKINGKKEDVKKGSTVLAILEEKSVRPEMIAVELNGDLLPREEYGQKVLNHGDILEFLYYMAGGNLESTRYRKLSLRGVAEGNDVAISGDCFASLAMTYLDCNGR